jgi:hypothetical protein
MKSLRSAMRKKCVFVQLVLFFQCASTECRHEIDFDLTQRSFPSSPLPRARLKHKHTQAKIFQRRRRRRRVCIFLLESSSAAVCDTMSPLPVFLRPDSFVLLLPCTLPRGPSLSIIALCVQTPPPPQLCLSVPRIFIFLTVHSEMHF